MQQINSLGPPSDRVSYLQRMPYYTPRSLCTRLPFMPNLMAITPLLRSNAQRPLFNHPQLIIGPSLRYLSTAEKRWP